MLQRIFKTNGIRMGRVTNLLVLGALACILVLGAGISPAECKDRPARTGISKKMAKKMERAEKRENRYEKRRKDRRIVMSGHSDVFDRTVLFCADKRPEGPVSGFDPPDVVQGSHIVNLPKF